MSNEVIRRCTVAIDLEKIFDGSILSSQKTLNECIDCCQQWQEIYNNVTFLLVLSHSFDQIIEFLLFRLNVYMKNIRLKVGV